MFNKDLLGEMFDFNHDGKLDAFERAADFGAFTQLIDDGESSEITDLNSFASTEHVETVVLMTRKEK